MEHLMEIMTTGTETFCIVLLLNTFFERKYTSYRFFFPLSAAFLFYLWLPLNTILATSFVTKLFISILIWLVFSQIFYTGALPFHLFLLCSFFIILSGLDYFTLLGISYIFSFSFSDALSNSALYILGAFVSRTLLLLFSIIIYRLFKAKTSMILSSSTWIALLLFPVFSILLFGVTIEIAMAQNKISFNLILSGIGLLLFNISLFLLLGKMCIRDRDVVEQIVHITVKPLLTLHRAPHRYPLFYKPFQYKRRFVILSAQTVEHEDQQDIKLLFFRFPLDFLQFVSSCRGDLKS